MTTTTIEIPSGLAGDIANNASQLITNFSGVITLIVGVLLAMLAIDFLIGSFHRGK